jgi:3-oxoacyl-[acyl-carrier protein] reductase
LRNVIVTGGSRGIGLAVAEALVGAGYRVIAVARNPGERLPAAIEALDPASRDRLRFRAFDLSETAAIPDFVRSLRAEVGPIYGLVNNAGIGSSGVLATMPDAQIEELVRLNTMSPLLLTKYIVRSMMADGVGRIVNISSIVSFTGFNGLAVYSATKASMVGFTRSLAREVGSLGITVNAVAPGFVETEMTDSVGGQDRERIMRRSALRRLIEARDVANAVEFLLSDKARNITGTTLTVDAGSTA